MHTDGAARARQQSAHRCLVSLINHKKEAVCSSHITIYVERSIQVYFLDIGNCWNGIICSRIVVEAYDCGLVSQ